MAQLAGAGSKMETGASQRVAAVRPWDCQQASGSDKLRTHQRRHGWIFTLLRHGDTRTANAALPRSSSRPSSARPVSPSPSVSEAYEVRTTPTARGQRETLCWPMSSAPAGALGHLLCIVIAPRPWSRLPAIQVACSLIGRPSNARPALGLRPLAPSLSTCGALFPHLRPLHTRSRPKRPSSASPPAAPSSPFIVHVRQTASLPRDTVKMGSVPHADAPTVKVFIAGGSYCGLSAAANLLDLGQGLSPRMAQQPYIHHAELPRVNWDITIADERDGFCASPCLDQRPVSFLTSLTRSLDRVSAGARRRRLREEGLGQVPGPLGTAEPPGQVRSRRRVQRGLRGQEGHHH